MEDEVIIETGAWEAALAAARAAYPLESAGLLIGEKSPADGPQRWRVTDVISMGELSPEMDFATIVGTFSSRADTLAELGPEVGSQDHECGHGSLLPTVQLILDLHRQSHRRTVTSVDGKKARLKIVGPSHKT